MSKQSEPIHWVGGSALCTTMFSAGILLNISQHAGGYDDV